MPSRVWLVSLVACGVAFSCNGGRRDTAAPLTPSGGRSGTGGASVGGSSVSSAGSSGLASGGAQAAMAGAGGAAEGGQGGAPEAPLPSICKTAAVWGAPTRLTLSTAVDDLLLSVTPDELSILWFAGEELRLAERPSRSAAFGSATPIDGGADYFAGATLSPDGLTLLGVRRDGSGFGELHRTTRAAAFSGVLDQAPFTALYEAPGAQRANGPFADPVFGADGLLLLYSALDEGSDGVSSIFAATRLGAEDAWPWGTPVAGSPLQAIAGQFRHPTALSADALALFYWDDADGVERVAWRGRQSAAFGHVESLGDRKNAVPSADCQRLYFSAPGSGGSDVFVAEQN